MPEIREKSGTETIVLGKELVDLESEKLLLRHQSIKLQVVGLLTFLLLASSLIIQAFAILESNKLVREKNALSLISESSEIFAQEKSSNTLDFLEIVAMSYKNNVADKTIVENYFKQPAIAKVTELEEFIQEVDQNNSNTNWKEIRILVEQWKKTTIISLK